MRELHEKAGNPDLKSWRLIKLVTLSEASLLVSGINPYHYSSLADYNFLNELNNRKPTNWEHAHIMLRALLEAICTHEIKSPMIRILDEQYNNGYEFTDEQAKISIEDMERIVFTKTKIHRDELSKWLKKYGYIEPPQQNTIIVEAQPVTHKQHESVQHNNIVLLPEPTYTTPALEAVNGVIQEFWADYNPDKNQSTPKQDVVASWIMANYPDVQGKELCIYIDKICRHPTAKRGGNTKLKLQSIIKDVTPIKQ